MNYYFTGLLIVMLVVLAFCGGNHMSNKPLNIGEEARVQMPMKTVAWFDRYRSNGR